ncbi:MAG: ATP-binding cassette domain-containing protein, partial [Nannocystaceae bacterium]
DLDLLRTSPRRRAAVVGWLPQHEPQAEGIDVEEFLHGACFRYQASRAALTHRIHKQLDVSGLAQLAQAPLQQLSGGERQRLGLAALMLQAPEWWLCDEPANHLDPKQQLLTYGALGRAWSDGQALICVTHDINLLWHAVPEARWEDVRVLGMNRGEIVVDEPLVSSALVEGLREIYELDVALVREAGVPRLAMTLPWEAK